MIDSDKCQACVNELIHDTGPLGLGVEDEYFKFHARIIVGNAVVNGSDDDMVGFDPTILIMIITTILPMLQEWCMKNRLRRAQRNEKYYQKLVEKFAKTIHDQDTEGVSAGACQLCAKEAVDYGIALLDAPGGPLS